MLVFLDIFCKYHLVYRKTKINNLFFINISINDLTLNTLLFIEFSF